MKMRIGAVEKAQNLLRESCGRGLRLRQRTTDWVKHTFRERNKEADMWAGKGAKGCAEEWVDSTRIAWQEVTGLCGSHDNGKMRRRHCLHVLLGTTRMVCFLQKVYQRIVPWKLKWMLIDILVNGLTNAFE